MKNQADKIIFGVITSSVIVCVCIAVVTLFYTKKLNFSNIFTFPEKVKTNLKEEQVKLLATDDDDVNDAIQREDWAAAAGLIEKHYGAQPADPEIKQTLGVLLYNLAVTIMDNNSSDFKKLSDAVLKLKRSNYLLSNDPANKNRFVRTLANAGLLAYENNFRVEGKAWIEEARRNSPDESYVCYVLGYFSYREGNYREAASSLKKALVDKEEHIRKSAGEMLVKISKDASQEAGFASFSSSLFTVRFEGEPRPELTSRIISALESSRSRIGQILGYTPSRTIEVIVYTSQSFAVQRDMPDWVGGYFDGRIRLSAVEANSSELNKILGHEFTHAAIYDKLGHSGPIWFEEGVAQFITDGSSYSKDSLKNNIQGSNITFSNMQGSFMKFSKKDAKAAYALSFAAILYLNNNRGSGVINQTLNNLASGKKIEEILKSDFGLDFQTLDSETRRWLGM